MSLIYRMSLFLGNISPHIRKEELERVFWRFGRSKVQLKDGYGFVVYDVPADAERALRALREGQRDFRAVAKSSNRNPKVPCVDDHEDMEDNEGDQNQNLHEGVHDDDGGGAVRFSSMENDRWGAPTSGTLNDGGGDNGTEFDRYEPYHGYDENGDRKMTSSPERPLKDNSPNHSRPQQTCFNCGLKGHIKRNCPQLDGQRRGKFGRYGDQESDEISFRSRGGRRSDRTWGSPPVHGDRPLTRRLMSGRKAPSSGKFRSLPPKQVGLLDIKENHQPLGDSHVIKSSRKGHETTTRGHRKKARSGSSQHHSDSAPSGFHSRSWSSKSVSGIRSLSHSLSVSSRCRSASRSSASRSQSPRSRSRSRPAKSLSLSISLGQQSSSHPNEAQIDATGNSPKGHLGNVTVVESKDLLLENKHTESKVDSDNLEPKVTSVSQKDENARLPDTGGDHLTTKNESEKNSHAVPSEEGALPAENSSSENFREMGDLTRASLGKPSPQVPMSSQVCNSTSMSSQEMCMVLKHYGLMAPKENELHLPVDAYFGAARLWPWEMIYYRRLKKGPISTENYSRRIAQNAEFGIVDKYIRSSSGWGERDGGIS
ncbi:hypothetical protein ACLOJK_005950 [Asimina triloba]